MSVERRGQINNLWSGLLINSGIEKIVFKKEDGTLGYYDIKEWVRDESLDHQRKIQQYTGKG